MSKAERGYIVFTGVDANGIAQTGLTALINDRNTTLTVPWAVSSDREGDQEITWLIEDEDGTEHEIVVTVNVDIASGGDSTTISYTKGNYVIDPE
jgi:hypothetical protein